MPVKQRIQFHDVKIEKLFAEHRERWIGCQACSLCKTRSKVVLYRGSLPCDVLFVGEGPGESEDSIGFPFIGPAGQLLDQLVGAAYMAPYTDCPPECTLCGRSVTSNYCHTCGCPFALGKVGITNIVACLPIQPDELSSGTIRPPTKDEAAACSERLAELYHLASPQVVICLGNIAERFFLKAFDKKTHSQINVRHLLHPSAILRTNNPAGQSLQEKRWVLQLSTILKELK